MDVGIFFVVHVWRDAHGFHATARDVTREDSEEFDDPEMLARFLAEHGVIPPAATEEREA